VVAAGIAAAFNAQLLEYCLLLNFLLVDVSIRIYSIMIAAATGVVSVIALDETILIKFKQQQDFDYHKIPLCAIGNIDRFISIYLY
jgi:CIC family chloride channel protein